MIATPERCVRGYAYFFHSTVTGQTKIGKSKHPDTRLQQLKCHVPGLSDERAYCFATDDPKWLELTFHEVFADCRAQGEWFNLTDADEAMLLKLPDFISEPRDFSLELRARWVANLARPKDGEDHVSLDIKPRLALLLYLLEILSSTGEEEAVDSLCPMILAECERRMAALDPRVSETIRQLLGLPKKSD